MPNITSLLRVALRAVATLLFVALVAPWVTLAVLRALLRWADDRVRPILAFPFALRDHARCPRGHRSALTGIFECRSCGGLFAGWAFQTCPVCGQSCGFVACEHDRCALAIRNPFL